jgi:hypothetical protein
MKFRCMILCWIAFWAVVPARPQASSVSIKPQESLGSSPSPTARLAPTPELKEKHVAIAGRPILGYVLGPGPVEVHTILGAAKAPQLGEQVLVPNDTKSLYLSPRQQYALLEQSSDEPVAVWALHRTVLNQEKQDAIAVNGAIAHPDIVVFSPRGDAAVLYSQAAESLQIVSHLPAQPSLSKQLSTARLGTPSQFAVTDDASLVVAALADGRLAFSVNGADWQPLVIGFTPRAWTFIPNTHDLAISDTAQKMILLLPAVGEASSAIRILAQDVAADRLAVTKNGAQLVAANLAVNPGAGQQLWAIDLKTGAVAPQQGFAKLDSLSALRDGFTFLLSISPHVSLLKLTAPSDLYDLAAHAGN